MVYVAEWYGIIADMTLEDIFLLRIPAFEFICSLDVFVFHNRLLPFHILAIGDFRVWAVEMSCAYGTCIALGF